MNTPYRLLTTQDVEAWQTALPSDVCVMGGLEFARVQERNLGQPARLFVVGSAACRIVYPFFLRGIPGQPLEWDTVTPEYTGPILLGPETGALSEACFRDFREGFSEFCHATGIVAEFAHLNPWNARTDLLDAASMELNREIIYVDLTLGEEGIWKHSLSSDTRRQTRQAHDAGVVVRAAESEEDVLAFHRLHHQTMERLSAQEQYYVTREYFLDIFASMPRNAVFMLSEYQGRTVAGGLYFQDATNVYWHLSALDMEFAKVRPVNAYHFEMLKRSCLAGKQHLLCGGAHRSGDGVFRFKAGFSPLRIPFWIYKRIHDPERYAALTEAWFRRHPGLVAEPGFFPAYRSGTPDPADTDKSRVPSVSGPDPES
jgi:hypothetical protein